MTAKFISTVLKVASVVTVPLAMLAASVPASAQRPAQRNNSAWHFNNGRYNNGHPKKGHHKNKHYKNGQYRNGRDNGRDNGRYDNDRDDDRDNNGRYNNGQYGNGQYGNGQYGQQRPVYGNRGVTGKSLPAPQRGNGYPSRGATRYPSTAIPGFPNPVAGNRSGKALPGTSQQNQQYNARHHGH